MAAYKIAYLSRIVYPSPAAHAIQTLQMAAAFARQTANAHLFTQQLKLTPPQLFQQYGVVSAPLHLWSLHTNFWPSRTLYARRNWVYNSALLGLLSTHSFWWSGHRVLYMRGQSDYEYWGLLRDKLPWLKNWIFVYEAHDLQANGSKTAVQRAIRAYDLVIAVTETLAADIETFMDGTISVQTVPLSTGLKLLPPTIEFRSEQVILGYLGTVDQAHGVDMMIAALKLLPPHYKLRIVGRVVDPAWLKPQLVGLEGRVDLCPQVSYAEVQAEIDRCDIVLAPAGQTTHSERYRSPLKIFDYMARGKPIVAARVSAHAELLHDGENAVFFNPFDPSDLAARICTLVEQPELAQQIAHGAWQDAPRYTYDARAQQLLSLFDQVRQA